MLWIPSTIKKKKSRVLSMRTVEVVLCLRSTGCASGRGVLQGTFTFDESNRLGIELLNCASRLGNHQIHNFGSEGFGCNDWALSRIPEQTSRGSGPSMIDLDDLYRRTERCNIDQIASWIMMAITDILMIMIVIR